MDTTAEDIIFDEEGVCNYCKPFLEKLNSPAVQMTNHIDYREKFIAQVKASGQGKEYDCIVGVSGGVDSSYALYLAVKNGLRPLAVHLDNGWNSESASHNITNLVNELGVDLYTHVIDWDENRDMQMSFFKAHVVDIELLMDNAMFALNYQQAAKYNLKYILGGTNMTSEGLPLPKTWCHYKFDARNIRRIQKKFGQIPIKTHPLISTFNYVWYEYIRKIKWISFLDYFSYNKQEALDILQKELGYKPYPYKHYESVFTRFYQASILPEKFGYDKRRVHLSTLVTSGQMSRSEAIDMMNTRPYIDPQQEEQDRVFVIKKLGFTDESFQDYLKKPGIPHVKYGSEIHIYHLLLKINRFFKGVRQA